jgi:hypothetical protein
MMSRTSMASAPKKKNWVTRAVPKENRGKFREKAERAGKTTKEFAAEKADAPGTLGKEARLAETLMGMSHKRKKSPLYDRKKD